MALLTSTGNKVSIAHLLFEDRHPRADWWLERLAALLAIAGVVAASLPGYQVRTWQDAASDFKTLYASARCFWKQQEAYNFANIGHVFTANHIVTPASWYAHAPTYPPFTFWILGPVVALPMYAAACFWLFCSALAIVVAIWALNENADRSLSLPRSYRLVLMVLVAISPLVSFGLFIGNVSVVGAALCIVAVCARPQLGEVWSALLLTGSLLLKPHIALCLLAGMIFSRDPEDRRIALRSIAFFAGAVLLFVLWSAHLPLGAQWADYARMVRSEIATGCLNPRNHELLSPAPQITSFESLLGFSMKAPLLQVLTSLFLLAGGGFLIYLSRRASNASPAMRLELLAAWSAFGLLATYHRTHDAIILFLLLPSLLWRICTDSRRLFSWLAFACGFGMVAGSSPPNFDWVARVLHLPWLADFLTFRQSALSTLLLFLLLVIHLWREQPSHIPRRRMQPNMAGSPADSERKGNSHQVAPTS